MFNVSSLFSVLSFVTFTPFSKEMDVKVQLTKANIDSHDELYRNNGAQTAKGLDSPTLRRILLEIAV